MLAAVETLDQWLSNPTMSDVEARWRIALRWKQMRIELDRPEGPDLTALDGICDQYAGAERSFKEKAGAEKSLKELKDVHCSLQRHGDVVLVEDHSTYGTFLNGARIEGSAPLAAGDRLRLGTPGIVLQLIAVD